MSEFKTATNVILERGQASVICLITLLLLSLGYLGISDALVASVSGSESTYFIARTKTGKPGNNPDSNFHATTALSSKNEANRYKGTDKWLSASPSLMGFNPDVLKATIAKIGQMTGIYSLLIVRSKHMVVERYFREGHRFKPHNLKSASKTVLSALLGIAIDEGRLGLDQPISELLPQAKNLDDPRKAGITIRHLLTMTSGLEPTSYQSYNKWILKGDWVQTALDRPLLAEPGTHFQYSTGNTHILSAILTLASGMSTKEYAIRRLFGPMNITVQGWDTDPKGIYQGGNNLSLMPRDMVKFGQLYLDDGKFGHKQIVPKWWIDVSTSAEQFGASEIYGAYGYLWFVHPGGRDAFVAVGFGGQYIYVSPAYDFVVVVTSTLESKGREWEKRLFKLINNGIIGSIETGQQQLLLATGLNDPESTATATEPKQSRTSYVDPLAPPIGQTIRNVILRKDSSRKSKRIGLVPSGSKIDILETKGQWHRVQYSDKEGWLHGAYVKIITPRQSDISSRPVKALTEKGKQPSKIPLSISAANRKAEAATYEGRAATRLNLRSGPSPTDSVLIILKPGTKLEIKEQVGSWLRVQAGRQEGWVSADFVQIMPSKAITVARPQPEATPSIKQLASQKKEQKPATTVVSSLQPKEDYIKVQALVEKLHNRLQASDQIQQQLAGELTSARKQIGILQKNLTESHTAREKLGTLLAKVRTTLQNLQADRHDLSLKLAKVQKNLENQQQANVRSETARKKQTSELEEIRTTVASLGKALKAEQATKDNLKTALSTLRRDLKTQQKVAAHAAAQSENARNVLLSEIDGEHTRIGALGETLKSVQTARDNLRDDLNAELSTLRQDLKTQQEIAFQATLERDGVKLKMASAGERIGNLQKDIAESQTAREDLENALANIRTTIQSLQTDRHDLSLKLAKVQKNLENQQQANAGSETARKKQTSELEEIRTTVVSLGKALKTEQATKDNLKTALSTLRQNLKTQQNVAAQSEIARKALLSQIDGEHTRIGALGETLKSMQTNRDNLKTELSALRKDLKTAQKAVTTSETEQSRLKGELAFTRKQIGALQKDLTKSHTAQENLGTSLANVRTTIQSLQTDRQDLTLNLAKVQKNLAEQRQVNAGSEITRKKQTSELEEIRTTIVSLEKSLKAELSAKDNLRNNLNAELSALRKDLKIGQKAVTTSETEQSRLKGELAFTRKQIGALQKDLTKSHTAQENLGTSLANVRTTIQSLQTDRQDLTLSLAKVQKNLAEQRQLNAGSEITRKKQTSELEEIRTTIVSLEKFLKAELSAKDNLRNNLNAELSALLKDLKIGQKAVTTSETEQSRLKGELAFTLKQIGALQKDLTKSHTAQENLGTSLVTIRTTIQSLQTDRQDLRSKLTKVQKNIEDQQQANARFETTRKDLTSEGDGVRMQIGALNETLKSMQATRDNLKTDLSALRQDLKTQQKVIAQFAIQSENSRKVLLSELDGERTRIGALSEAQKSMQTTRDNLRDNLNADLSTLRKDLQTQQKVANRSTTQFKSIHKALTLELASAHAKIDSLSKALINSQTARKDDSATIENLLLELQQQRKSALNLESAQKTLMTELGTVRKQISVLETASETSQKSVMKGPVIKPEIAVAPIKSKNEKTDKPIDIDTIESFLQSWVEAWEQKDIKEYLAHYSEAFQPPGDITLTLWHKQRRQRLLKPAFIKIEIRNIQKKIADTSRVQVTFNQMYQSNTYSDRSFKILDLHWENKRWKILKESSKHIK